MRRLRYISNVRHLQYINNVLHNMKHDIHIINIIALETGNDD